MAALLTKHLKATRTEDHTLQPCRTRITVCVIFVASIVLASAHVDACEMDKANLVSTYVRDISLAQQIPARNVYLRAGHYALFIDVSSFGSELERRHEGIGRPSLKRLQDALRIATARSDSADLFITALDDPLFLPQIEYTVASLLDAGRVTVVDAWRMLDEKDRIVPQIQLRTLGGEGYEGRAYCTAAGELLLEVTDRIDD